jgi:hypothetical protein
MLQPNDFNHATFDYFGQMGGLSLQSGIPNRVWLGGIAGVIRSQRLSAGFASKETCFVSCFLQSHHSGSDLRNTDRNESSDKSK